MWFILLLIEKKVATKEQTRIRTEGTYLGDDARYGKLLDVTQECS